MRFDTETSTEERIDRLHAGGVVDMNFDLTMDLHEKRERKKVLESEFLPDFETGNICVVGAAIYIEDRYLPHNGLRVALDEVGRLYAETAGSERFAVCKSFREIQEARERGRISFLITMEGIEPLGIDRSEERRVGKECRSRWTAETYKKNKVDE